MVKNRKPVGNKKIYKQTQSFLLNINRILKMREKQGQKFTKQQWYRFLDQQIEDFKGQIYWPDFSRLPMFKNIQRMRKIFLRTKCEYIYPNTDRRCDRNLIFTNFCHNHSDKQNDTIMRYGLEIENPRKVSQINPRNISISNRQPLPQGQKLRIFTGYSPTLSLIRSKKIQKLPQYFYRYCIWDQDKSNFIDFTHTQENIGRYINTREQQEENFEVNYQSKIKDIVSNSQRINRLYYNDETQQYEADIEITKDIQFIDFLVS